MDTTEGGCLCGQVRYRATGTPTNTMICHCQSCRKSAGSPVVAWITYPKSRFEITRGQPAKFRSSDPVVRTFCPKCGTPLTYEHNRSPESIDITTCSLDDPNAFPPTHHSWLSDDIAWVRFGDALPTYPQSRPG